MGQGYLSTLQTFSSQWDSC